MGEAAETEYVVTLRYHEPTYAARHQVNRIYSATYRLRAGSAEAARARALREFEEMARLSSVSWTRVVLAVEVRQERRAG